VLGMRGTRRLLSHPCTLRPCAVQSFQSTSTPRVAYFATRGIEVINGFEVRGGTFAISGDGPFHSQFQTFSRKIDQRWKPEYSLVWKLHLIGIDNRSHRSGLAYFQPQFPMQSFPVQIPSQSHLSGRHRVIGSHRMGLGMVRQKCSRYIPEI
jgi:hypothetical protein